MVVAVANHTAVQFDSPSPTTNIPAIPRPSPNHQHTAWQEYVAVKREAAADAAALEEAVGQHMLRWRLRRMLRSWQASVAGCAAGRAVLLRMGDQAERRAVAEAFSAWRACVAARQQRLSSLKALVAVRQRHDCAATAFAGWRTAVEDRHGTRLQAAHAAAVLSRMRQRHVLLAWLEWRRQRADRRERWEAAIAYMRQRRATLRLDTAFGAWQEVVEEHKEQRALFYE